MKALQTVAQAAVDRGRVTEETIDTLRSLVDENKDGVPDTKKQMRELKAIERMFDKAAKKDEVRYEMGARRLMDTLLTREPSKKPSLVGPIHITWVHDRCLDLRIDVKVPKGSEVAHELRFDEKHGVAVAVIGSKAKKNLPGPSAKLVEKTLELQVPSEWVAKGKFSIDLHICDPMGNVLKELELWTFPDSDF